MEFKIGDIVMWHLGYSCDWAGVVVHAHASVAPLPLAIQWLEPNTGHTNTLTGAIAPVARIHCPAEELL